MMLGRKILCRTVSRRYLFTVLVLSFLFVLSLLALVRHPLKHHFNNVGIVVESESDIEATRGSGREQDSSPLGKHTVTPDGLLIVNPDGPHPIFQLIHDAEAAWDAKHARASKTLAEAVAEYRRRYRRAPPLGFDKWWDYVVKHRVQLPDEYDEIFEDIEPFWGIDPRDLARTQQAIEIQDGMVTIEKTDALPLLEVVRSNFPPDKNQHLLTRIDDMLGLVREVEHVLPPLRFSVFPHDNPELVSDWRIKSMALEAAANGTTLTETDLPVVTERGWLQACSPHSPARLQPPAFLPSSHLPPSSPKTFIASHRDTMNPCMHPSLLTSHGQFLRNEVGPWPQRTIVPLFSFCATLLHHDIRPPLPYDWKYKPDSDSDLNEDEDEDGNGAFDGDVPWERKTNEKLGWRGRSTGMHAGPHTQWISGHRARLVTLTNAHEGEMSVLRVPTNESEGLLKAGPVGEPERMPLAHVNPEWMDVAFAGTPIGCDKKGGTCDEMGQMWTFRKVQPKREEGQYKFILDVDGNGWSGRFKRLITSHALIFKATVYPEWYTSRIMPWVHYVPIQVSYADLYDAVSFFRVHDDLARRIARAGRSWSRRYWRREDMTAYLYRLLLEYARVTSLDRASMDYVLS